MALIKCPECGREVSDRAAACPHCGNPLRTAPTTPATPATSSEPARPWYRRPIGTGGGCLVLIVFIGVVSVLVSDGSTGSDDSQSAPRPTSVDLAAAVRFTGTQFVITNNDAFNWSNCKLEINSGIVRGGYELKTRLIASRSTYTVGAMQFAKGSGERFNPLGMKPQSFSVACDTPRGRGYYYGSWQ